MHLPRHLYSCVARWERQQQSWSSTPVALMPLPFYLLGVSHRADPLICSRGLQLA